MELYRACAKISCLVISLDFLAMSLLCLGAEKKEVTAEQEERIITLNDWDKEVEMTMVMYTKSRDGTLLPGYLANRGVFYEFSVRDMNVLIGAENRLTDDEKRGRIVSKPDKIIVIGRPVQYWYVLWKDGAYYPGCWCKKDGLFFVFLGFGGIDKDKIPWQGPISRAPVYLVDHETGNVFKGPATRLPKTEIVLVNGPAK